MKHQKVSGVFVALLMTGFVLSAQESKPSRAQTTTLSAKAVAPKVDLLPEDLF